MFVFARRLLNALLFFGFFPLASSVLAFDTDNDGFQDALDPFPADASKPVFRPLFIFNGDDADDEFGWAVAGIGDINGDGYDDLIAGACHDETNGNNSGLAKVLNGADGGVLYTYYGQHAGDGLGCAVNAAGDVNADGYADFVIGVLGDDIAGTDFGRADVYSGVDGTLLHTFYGLSAGDNFGVAVSAAGDTNADGYDDVIAGSFSDTLGLDVGSARVFSGKDGSTLRTLYGVASEDHLGQSVASAGDLDGDGYDEVLVGVQYDDTFGVDAGSARVINGKTGAMLYLFFGEAAGDAFGTAVSGAGDVNNDGYPDLIIGGHFNDNVAPNAGMIRVYSGVNGSVLYTKYGSAENDYFGQSVSGAGDMNNDGYADFLVGARYADNNGNASGSAFLYSGQDGSVLYRFDGDNAYDLFGKAVAAAGDINNDGYADIIVGATLDDNNGSASGSVKILSFGPAGTDSDADGVVDSLDAFPLDDTETADTDGDGTGDNADSDDDNDGIPDSWELLIGSDPLVVNVDNDHDGIPNYFENTKYGTNPLLADTDGDGLKDGEELFVYFTDPLTPEKDTDSDGELDIFDDNDDNDDWLDVEDPFPLDASKPALVDGEIDYQGFQMSAGHSHVCVLDDEGVMCWGDSVLGQVNVPELINPRMIASSSFNNCALDDAGVVCWGDANEFWTKVPKLINPKIMDGGSYHYCALDDNGISCWGSSDRGQLDVPELIAPVSLSVGGNDSCVIDSGEIKCWGDSESDKLKIPDITNPVQVEVGENHICALGDEGVVCWGGDDYSGELDVPALSNPRSISIGYNHSCAVDDNGVICWGNIDEKAPEIDVLGSIVSGYGFSCAPASSGIRCWGPQNDFYFIKNVPRPLLNPKEISTGLLHTCVRDEQGVICWGRIQYYSGVVLSQSNVVDVDISANTQCRLTMNGYNCFGFYSAKDTLTNPLMVSNGGEGYVCSIDHSGIRCQGELLASNAYEIPYIKKPLDVSTGVRHSCALGENGVKCWGYKDEYWDWTYVPTLQNPYEIEVGASANCALDDSGAVCWGVASSELLVTPVLNNPSQLVVADDHACVLDDAGVVCWGSNDHGQATPPSLRNPYSLTVGRFHSCALDDSGPVCWGEDYVGNPFPSYRAIHYRHFQVLDSDADGVSDQNDPFPLNPNEWLDTDNDGLGDNQDTDDDNDLVNDEFDAFPLDASESLDSDGDGYGNNIDYDDDQDGCRDTWELLWGSDPLMANLDQDGDGVPNYIEVSIYGTDKYKYDTDGDGFSDGDEIAVFGTNPLVADGDNDNDRLPDQFDEDDDNDGMPDTWEVTYGFDPFDFADRWSDVDVDGGFNFEEYEQNKNPIVFDDLDGDGSSDYEEIVAGTDENNENQKPYWWKTIYGGFDDELGASLSGVGDLNGDGIPDFASYIDGWFEYCKSVIYSGKDTSLLREITVDDDCYNRDYVVRGLGDVNSDGYADLALADKRANDNSGMLYLISGVDGTVIYSVSGFYEGQYFGSSLNILPDINNDGIDEVLVGSANYSSKNDYLSVDVISGIDGQWLDAFELRSNTDSYSASDMMSAGDVDGDGYADVILGNARIIEVFPGGYRGIAQIYSVKAGSYIASIFNWNPSDGFGANVAGIGDINKDGYDDLAVSATGDDSIAEDAGMVYVYSGKDRSLLYSVSGEMPYDFLGSSLTPLGDFNLDGYPDFIVGAELDEKERSGEAPYLKIISGLNGSTLYKCDLVGLEVDSGFNIEVVGDIDGDNRPDFIVGMPEFGQDRVGAIRVFRSIDILNDDDLDYWLNDSDADGQPDIYDEDDDNDGVPDVDDAFPFDATETTDTDGDGAGDNADLDDDNDGISDLDEIACGSDPLDNNSVCPTDESAGHSDFDADADDDLLLRNGVSGKWQLFLIQAGGVAGSNPYAAYTGAGWVHQANLDADADGDNDVLLRNTGTGIWRLFATQAGAVSGSVVLPLYTSADYLFQTALDADGDGDEDILLRNSVTGKWVLFILQSGAVVGSQAFNLFASSDFMFAARGDFDGDMDDDILLRSTSTGKFKKFDIEAGVTTPGSGLSSLYASSDYQLQVAADMNADGRDDLLFRNTVTGKYTVFLINNNVVDSQLPFNVYSSVDYNFVSELDADADGDADILLRSTSSGNWVLFSVDNGAVTGQVGLTVFNNSGWQLQR